jgi:hypothetical protein
MDCSCNLFGVATAARVPVKRYNLITAAIYPVVEPEFDDPLSPTEERALKKLQEYLERNQHRIAKVRAGQQTGSGTCFSAGSKWVL